MPDAPDYARYTLRQLQDARRLVDAVRFPDRQQAIDNELRKRRHLDSWQHLSTEERFARAKRHDDYAIVLAHDPGPPIGRLVGAVVFLIIALGVAGGASWMAFVALDHGSPTWEREVSGALALIVLATLVVVALGALGLWRAIGLYKAPVERVLAIVIDIEARSRMSTEPSSVRHFVKVELDAGGEREFFSPAYVARELTRGRVGMCYLRRSELVEFREIAV